MARLSPSLLLILSVSLLALASSSEQWASREVGLENPTLHIFPPPIIGQSCERIRIAGISRLNIKSYASSLHLHLDASETVPKKLHAKIEVYFHRNASSGLCQSEKGEWHTLQNGQWSATMSPYVDRFIDIKFTDKIQGSMTISAEEKFQPWRLFLLCFGLFLLLSAPVVSTWVPFYYSSSMALGVLLVVLLILFQGMKLLPMGKKNILYLTLYGSLLGVGSFIAHYFSTLVNSILVNFGLSEEMYNPVSVFLLVGIVLAGAALGHWIVRKFVLSEDGNVDAGIAQFVKWAMRMVATVAIFESTRDTLLALIALTVCSFICSLLTPKKWQQRRPLALQQAHSVSGNLWPKKVGQASASHRNAEFFRRSPSGRTAWTSPRSPYTLSNLSKKNTVKGFLPPNKKMSQQQDYYSSFHRTPRRKFSKKEWEDFTSESTREALTEWASSPEVTEWLADNALRMRLEPDTSSDDSMESSEGSSEETVVENGSLFGLFKRY